MSSDVAIRVRDVSKHYLIYARPEDRLKQSIVPRLQRLLGYSEKSYFRPYRALSDISFDVSRGEAIGLVGRNGAGKTTLMEMLQGTLLPTSGEVTTKGRVLILQLGTGFNPEFTGRDNAALNAAVMGLTPAEIAQRMPAIVEFAGIGDFLDQPVRTYSSGMYARLAFAVAAHIDADILLVDEVLAVGDMAFAQKCLRFIDSFKKRGTLVLCSHDLAAIRQHCDRALWLDAGRLRMVGNPKEVCDEYQRMVVVEGDGTAEMKFGGRRMGGRVVEAPPGRDHRAAIIEQEGLRNAIKVFEFDDQATWHGVRLASIDCVSIKSPDGARLCHLTGGESVVLDIEVRVHAPLAKPIIGFNVRNRQGQIIFGDNTYLTYRETPVAVGAGARLVARFSFQMPFLPTGEYAITCAIADGEQADAVQQHWIDDAVIFQVISSHVVKGLCGIPIQSIELLVQPSPDAHRDKVGSAERD